MKRLAPVLFLDSIEAALPFWDRLGFERSNEVELEGALGFVILKKGAVEIMLQTRKSLQQDVPQLADRPFCAALFIEVPDLTTIEAQLSKEPLIFERRKTFYGSQEVCVTAPGGHVVTFAQFG